MLHLNKALINNCPPKASLLHYLTKILIALYLIATLAAQSFADELTYNNTPPLQWHTVSPNDIEGKGWSHTKNPFDRLPAKAEKIVRKEVWNRSRHSAGLTLRFQTDSPEIHIKWQLSSTHLSMSHMPTTAVSGIDLYAKDKTQQWRWVAAAKNISKGQNELVLAHNLAPAERRTFLMYLPLYNGVDSLQIGIPPKNHFKIIKPRKQNLIVFYGTSIVQGGCASRPGMPHPAIIGRNLDLPVINLGFSGEGKMDLEIAELLAELDASIYIIDCLPNMSADMVTERTEPFVRKLRQTRANTPILLVECPDYPRDFLRPDLRKRTVLQRTALRKAYENLKNAGVKNLYYMPGKNLFGSDGEGTVDGTHATDLGFYRFANFLQPLIKNIIQSKQTQQN